jgi:hypothetical protein
MRSTWLVLGLILLVGGVAYVKLMGDSDGDGTAATDGGKASAPAVRGGATSLRRDQGIAAPGADEASAIDAGTTDLAEQEKQAAVILKEIAAAHEARDRARYDAALRKLKDEAWEAPSARRFAVKLGWGALKDAYRREGTARVTRLDQARRLLSRGVYLEDAFAANGQPTEDRAKLITAIEKANVEVMGYGRRMGGGLEGVTTPYEVPVGLVPVQIVSRRKLRYGHNALLYWNHAGNLDPKRLRAGEVLLLPEEAVSLHVFLDRRLLAVFVGDWFVKEFSVGVGRPDKPTPTGSFAIGEKSRNPPWWGPNGYVPALDEKNELGSVWIPFGGPTLPMGAGFGIHGTNKPSTVGTACSNGCVRLHNEQAKELFWWVRRASAGGEATKVFIKKR